MTEKIISYQNAPVFYRVTGEGETVVLIHGFAEDGEVWNTQVNFLQSHFRLIIPDIPGSGQSQLIPGANLETYAEVIKLILDNELAKPRPGEFGEVNGNGNIGRHYATDTPPGEADKVIIIGHSMGGYITLAFAEKYPQYLHSFGLFHSSAFADDEEKKQVRTKAIDFIKTHGSSSFLKTTTPGLFTNAFAEKYPARVEGLIGRGKNFSPEALVQYYQSMMARPDRTAVLKTFKEPILFIIGEHDNAIPLESSLRQCYLPAQSHVHILDKSAHMGMWEEADKANNILKEFLDGY